MPAATVTAPVRGAAARHSAVVLGVALFLGACSALFLAGKIHAGVLPYPGCLMKRVTGVPCPGCGGTRSLDALAAGEIGPSLVLNPLAATACLLALAALPFVLLDAAGNRGRAAAALGPWMRRRRFGWVMGALVASNWIYLLASGR